MKALLYTSDPYEPSGVIGLFETKEQKEDILSEYIKSLICRRKDTFWLPPYTEEQLDDFVKELKEIEIPIGIYGEYY